MKWQTVIAHLLFWRRSCPTRAVPAAAPSDYQTRSVRTKHVLPLLGFVLPTIVVGYGFVIPRSPIAGVNQLTIGFGMTILGACIAYVVGVRTALSTRGR